MVQIIGEASIRIEALTDQLKSKVNRDLNEALGGVSVSTDPTAQATKALRGEELNLVKAEQEVEAASGRVARAQRDLTAAQKDGTTSADRLRTLNLALQRATLELGVAQDKVSTQTGRLAIAHAQLRKAQDDARRAADDSERGHRRLGATLTGLQGIITGIIPKVGGWTRSLAGAGRDASKTEVTARLLGRTLAGSTRAAIGAVTTGFTTMGRVGTVALSALLSRTTLMASGVAAAGGLIAPLALAFPALGIAGAGAMAAIKLGADGAKRAFQALTPTIQAMQKQVSNSFQLALEPAVQNLKVLLPQLTSGIKQVATALGGLATRVTDFLKTPAAVKELQASLTGAAQFIQGLGPGITDMIRGVLTLASEVAPQMRNIGTGIGSILTAFNNAVNQLKASGSLNAMFAGLPGLFRSLGAVLQPLLVILGNFGAALTGPLSSAITAIGSALTTAEPGLKAFGEGVGRALDALSPVLTALGPVISTVATQLGSTLGTAVSALAPIIQSVLPLVSQLATLFGGVLTSAFRALAPPLAILIKGFADALAPVVPPLTKAFQAFATALGPVASAIANTLVKVFQSLAPLLPVVVDAFAKLVPVVGKLLEAILPLLPPLADLIAKVLPPLIQLFTNILTPIINLATTILNILVPAITAILNVTSGVITGVINWFLNLGTNVTSILSHIGDFFHMIWNDISTFFTQAIQGIVLTATGRLNDIKSAVTTILSDIGTYFHMKWNEIADFFRGIWSTIYNHVRDGVNNVKNGVVDGFNAVVDWIRSLPGKFVDALGNLGTLLLNAGRNLIEGLLNGIKDGFENVKNFVSTIAGTIRNLKGPLDYDRRILIPHGKAMMSGLHDGLTAGFAPVRALVADMADQIAANFTPAPGVDTGASFASSARSAGGDGAALDPDTLARMLAQATADGVREGLSQAKILFSSRELASAVTTQQQANARRK